MSSIRNAAFAVILLFTAASAAAQEPIRIDQAQSGMLLLKTSRPGLYVPVVAVDTKVEINATGLIARATVTQTFTNSSRVCAEGLYVFPLPENAAVDHLVMTVGHRRIEGEVKKREAARERYEAAKHEGRKAALVEQHRANIFRVSVASRTLAALHPSRGTEEPSNPRNPRNRGTRGTRGTEEPEEPRNPRNRSYS